MATLKNPQKDCLHVSATAKKNRFLLNVRCALEQRSVNNYVLVSVGVSKLGLTNLIVDPGLKINGTNYCDVLPSHDTARQH